MKPTVAGIIVAGALLSCTSSDQQKESRKVIAEETVTATIDSTKVDRIKQIFYTLPSPLEMSLLFKKEGVQYHAHLLNDIKNRSYYQGILKKALNLGVYGADLSFSGLFSKHDKALQYYAASQILAEDIGVGQTFQQRFVERLEQNAGNKDTLIKVVSDFFLENEQYLKQSEQQDLSTYVLVGGWIEGLYLGTKISDEQVNAKGIRNIINNQKESLNNIVYLFQHTRQSNATVRFLEELTPLTQLFNEVEGELTPEQFEAIKLEVEKIRTSIVST